MNQAFSTIAVIFARGGSKGLPGKNIKNFFGKPLIAWSIEQARAVGRIKKVIVSTDSIEIAEIAKRYGADVPFIRPAHLAGDESSEWLAWRHALEYLTDVECYKFDAMISVPATSPLRISSDLERIIDVLEEGDVDIVVGVTDAPNNPYFNMVKANGDGTVGLVIPGESGVTRRQDAPIVYNMTTIAYGVRPEFVTKCNGIFEGKMKTIHIPKERSIDIDTELDFRLAEFIYEKVLAE